MKENNLQSNISKLKIIGVLVMLVGLLYSCSSWDKDNPNNITIGNAQTPTEAYRMLYAAVKTKDTEKIKQMMSKNSLTLAEMASAQQKKKVEEVLVNGFSETTFANSMPKMRAEMIKDNFATIEVWSEKKNGWEIVPFINEDGGWKAAFGDLFKGNFQYPGKSQSILEQENANAANPPVPTTPNINMGNVKMVNVNTANVKKSNVNTVTSDIPTVDNPNPKKPKGK